MIFSVSWFRASLPAFAALLLLSGCLQPEGTQDEEKEPHFMDGRRCANAMDYHGAIEQFEKALEVNPRNASAHFELGVLFDQKEPDPAAAIYHYQTYLRLNPKGPQADKATAHILACKQELARTVSLGPVTQTLQTEFEKLSEQNRKLTEENRQLHEEVDKWKVLANRPQPVFTNAPAAVVPPARLASDPVAITPPPTNQPSLPRPSPPNPAAVSARSVSVPVRAKRTHVVTRGETFATIARKYGIRVDSLMAANPRIDARHLRVGQSLILP